MRRAAGNGLDDYGSDSGPCRAAFVSEKELTLSDYAAVLRRRLVVVVVVFVAAISSVAAWSLSSTPMYRSTARVLLDQAEASDRFESGWLLNSEFADRLAANEVALIESQLVDDVAESRLGFEAEVSASGGNEVDVVSVSAEATEPERAQLVVRTYVEAYLDVRLQLYMDGRVEVAEQLVERIASIEDQIDSASPQDADRLQELRDGLAIQYDQLNISSDLGTSWGSQIIDQPDLPETPFAPQIMRNLILGGVLGLILGVGAGLMQESLDQSVRSRDALEVATPGVPSLARIPSFQWTPEVATLSRPVAPESEAFRRLRAALEFASIDQQGAVVLVTSASVRDGKTTVAANLAVVLAQAGRAVALVDADLRHPHLHHLFEAVDGLDGGLTSAVIGRTELADAAHELNVGNGRLWVYPSGPLPPTPAELLGSKQANRIFELLRDSVDIVIVDSPPVLPVADALVLSRMADATLLVANAERTRRNELAGAVDALDQAGARLVGTILNQASAGSNDTYYEYGRGYTIKPQRRRFDASRLRRSRDPNSTPWQSMLGPDDLPRFEAATKARSNLDGFSTETDAD